MNEETDKWNLEKKVCPGNKENTEIKKSLLRINLQHSKVDNNGLFIKPLLNMTIFSRCGGIIEDLNGVIDSKEEFGDLDGSECTWTIKVREGRTIKFTVEYLFFQYNHGTPCRRDRLEIRNGFSVMSPLLTQAMCTQNLTSFTLPETSTNGAFIYFKSTSKIKKVSYCEMKK